MITALDTQVGRIVSALENRGMRKDTLIVFTSDNGGATNAMFATGAHSPAEREASGGLAINAKPPASNAPFKGGKAGLHEGGVRVPAFFNWPGRLAPAVVDAPLHHVDIMPTLVALAGGTAGPDKPFDGRDAMATISAGKPSPHDDILINVEMFRGAIRKGDWKLIKVSFLPGRTELYDVVQDPGETRNVADQHPDVVRDLEARLLAYARQQKMSEWLKCQVDFLGFQGKTVLDPEYNIDGGHPTEKPSLPSD